VSLCENSDFSSVAATFFVSAQGVGDIALQQT
jgi:hypothetical protein